MAESGGLENRWTFTRPVGSNPTPSANFQIKQHFLIFSGFTTIIQIP